MKTSTAGVEFLERHEGVVLKAYRDPVGIWTIGAGLTKPSGVVTPRAGMVITAKEASRLLALALERNYEPRVRRAMPDAEQHEFDGGVSFDWNTGAIHRASWVVSWLDGDFSGVRSNLAKWRKAGGRVLPGLVRRRAEEADLILRGDYGSPHKAVSGPSSSAKLIPPMTIDQVFEVRKALKALGYDPGAQAGEISAKSVRAFQAAHGLTNDGKIGRATLSTIQRRLDAATKAKVGTVAPVAGGGGAVATDVVPNLAGLEWMGWAVAVGGLLYLAWTAFQYRDAIAAKINDRAPMVAAKLRSF